MRSAIVYFVFSVVAGLYAFYRASETIWGLRPNPLAYLCFFGSVLLLVAAIVAPFSQRAAAKLAIVGCIATACSSAAICGQHSDAIHNDANATALRTL